MFRLRRRILLSICSPIASIFSVGLSVYTKLSPQQKFNWTVFSLIAGVLIISSFLAIYFGSIKPLRDPSTNGELLLKTVSARIISYAKSKAIDVRITILIIHRRFIFFRFFRMRWASWYKTGIYYPDDN